MKLAKIYAIVLVFKLGTIAVWLSTRLLESTNYISNLYAQNILLRMSERLARWANIHAEWCVKKMRE